MPNITYVTLWLPECAGSTIPLSTMIELYKSPRAHPTIIPGKKRPLGTATP